MKADAKRFARKLQQASRNIQAQVERAVLQGADEIRDNAKRLAPVDDGDLKRSIGSRLGDPPGTRATGALRGPKVSRDAVIYASVWAGDDEAFYARWVEYGTAPHSLSSGGDLSRGKRQEGGRMHPGSAPQPFFNPAFRLGRKRAMSRVSRAVNKSIKDAAK